MLELQSLLLYSILFISLFFEIFLLITYLEVRDEIKLELEHAKRPVEHHPSVSIIVPCFNEERTATATVESILALEYPKDKLSVIVVDDGSTDSTLATLKRFESNPQVQVYSKANGGKASVLNFALGKIDSDLVGCLDADSFVSADALKVIVPYFEREDIMAVVPAIQVHKPVSVLQQAQKIEYSFGIFLRRMLSSLGALYVTPGPFSIFRTQVFRDLGGYQHAHHTEDMELALRMQKNHYRIVNSHRAHVYTVTPANLRALVKQRVRWTYGFLNNVFDYRELFFNRQHGHIGVFILPIATISIFSSLIVTGNLLWNIGDWIANIFIKYQAVGASWKMPSIASFDWYFLNTGATSFIVSSMLILTFVILFLAIRMAQGKAEMSRGVVYYLTLYVFIVPIWLIKALYNTFFQRSITWR